MNPSSEGFAELREKILNQALPLLDSDTLPVEDRFRLSLQVAQMRGSLEAYTKAFQVAERMEGDDKLLAYLDLLSEVDYVLQGGAEPIPEEVQPNEQQARPQQSPARQDESSTTPADRIDAATAQNSAQANQ